MHWQLGKIHIGQLGAEVTSLKTSLRVGMRHVLQETMMRRGKHYVAILMRWVCLKVGLSFNAN
jgi:hypothetical protein